MSIMTRQTADPEKQYTPIEAADIIGVSPRTVRRYLRDGFLQGEWRGPYLQSGYLISGQSINEFLESLTLDSPETD
jgi:DNA-binding transcriptional MerR regulator